MVQLGSTTESSSNEEEHLLRKTSSSLSDRIQEIKCSLINGQPDAPSSVYCRSEDISNHPHSQSPFTPPHHSLDIPNMESSIIAYQPDNTPRMQFPYTLHSPDINSMQSSQFIHPSTNIQNVQSPFTPLHNSPGIPSIELSTIVNQPDNIQHMQSPFTPTPHPLNINSTQSTFTHSTNIQSMHSPLTPSHHSPGISNMQTSTVARRSDNIPHMQPPFTLTPHSLNINSRQSSNFTHSSTNIQDLQSPFTPSHHSPGISNMKTSTVARQSDNFQRIQSSLTPNSSQTHSSTQTESLAELNYTEFIRSEFKKLHQWQSDMQNLIQTSMSELKNIIRNLKDNRKSFCKPDCLPFMNVEDFKNFKNATDEQYHSVVTYLKYLGGTTPRNSANKMIKECFDDEVLENYTFTGWLKKSFFKKTRFSDACNEALSVNTNFVMSDDMYVDAMTDALKTSKQRLRNRGRCSVNKLHKRQRHRNGVEEQDDDEDGSCYDEEDGEESDGHNQENA